MSDGSVVNKNGSLTGAIVKGDIIINNSDKFAGYVMLNGKIKGEDGSEIGHMLNEEIAVDNENNIIGRVFKIGASILDNKGNYIGRLSADGSVLGQKGELIGNVKNNGSYIDLDKKVSGYALQEVAKNRRN